MPRFLYALLFLILASAVTPPPGPAFAQERGWQERVTRDIEARGFNNVTGLSRRGENYIFQAQDLFGDKVRVVMNTQTGEIVGLSRVMPKKK